MLTCREVCENAQDYIDANSSVWMRLRIRAHLAMCNNCTNFVDQTRKTKHMIAHSLARETEAEVSPDLMDAFRQRSGESAQQNKAPDGVGNGRKENDT